MPIRSFSFSDHLNHWSLREVSFSPLNLLVGLSGVGKTKTIKALMAVKYAAMRDTEHVNGCSWSIEFREQQTTWLWKCRVAPLTSVKEGEENLPILEEYLSQNGQEPFVSRDEKGFMFMGNQLPKLKASVSALSLLEEEEIIQPLKQMLAKIHSPEISSLASFGLHQKKIDEFEQEYKALSDIKRAELPPTLKGFLLQRHHAVAFQRIVDSFKEIFDTVTSLEIRPKKISGGITMMTLVIRENGQEIVQEEISSGMMISFYHLLELHLAPPGTVFLIDEIENSMGINCLPEIVDEIKASAQGHQFIITSHHPYIINNIPLKSWKVVTRRGSEVTILDSSKIPALRTASKQQAFTLLMNATEYEEGIA